MSIFGKCGRCGWERPSGNHFHTSDACNDIRDAKLLRVARAANAYVSYMQLKHSREWDWEKAQSLYLEYDEALKEVEHLLDE